MADKNIKNNRLLEEDLDLCIHWTATYMNWAEAYGVALKYLRKHAIKSWLSITSFEIRNELTTFVIGIAMLIFLGFDALIRIKNGQGDWVHPALGFVGMFVMIFGLFYVPGIFRTRKIIEEIKSDKERFETLYQEYIENTKRLSIESDIQPIYSLAKVQEAKEDFGEFRYVSFTPSVNYQDGKPKVYCITLRACFENQSKYLTELAR